MTDGADTGTTVSSRLIGAVMQKGEPMSDLIDRQDAIDALDGGAELLRRVLDDTDIVGSERKKYKWGLGLIESYISDIEELPSAQPERKIELQGDESAIEILSELRSWFSCFDEKEGLAYHALSLAIRAIKANHTARSERKKGKWLRSGNCIFPYECENCGDTNERATPFCPNCGADMRGDSDG